MSQMIKFAYREFYDVPRLIVVRRGAGTYLLDSPFDDAKDEYDTEYAVYLMPELNDSDLKGDWKRLKAKALRLLGKVPVSSIGFDKTRRKEMDADVLARFGV